MPARPLRLKLPIQISPARAGDNNTEHLENCFASIDDQIGDRAKTPIAIVALPEHRQLLDLADFSDNKVRGVGRFNDTLLVAYGSTLYQVSATGAITTIGTIGTGTGVQIKQFDTTRAIIVDNPNGYVATIGMTNSVAQITDGEFRSVSAVAVSASRALFLEQNSGRFFSSDALAPTDYDGSAFATAEYQPDNATAIESVGGQILIFGPRSYEVWQSANLTPFPFARSQAYTADVGCENRDLVATYENLMAWVSPNGEIYLFNQQGISRIDTPAIPCCDIERLFFIFHSGQLFLYCWNGDKAFVFDIRAQLWHTRTPATPFGAQCVDNSFLVSEDGKVYLLQNGPNNYPAVIQTPVHITRNGRPVLCTGLQIQCSSGLRPRCNLEPHDIMLSWSDDGARTWSRDVPRSTGAKGDYGFEVRWDRLGRYKQRTFRFKIPAGLDFFLTRGLYFIEEVY